jgi:choline dehydrogenase-like flavoprotein
LTSARQEHYNHFTATFSARLRMARTLYDVVVVGSGAAGGTLSAHLARQGVKVAVVEGGPRINTRTDFNTHALPFEFRNRHIPTMKPGKPGFDTERSRGLGGKTMLWNAVAFRYSHRDFKGRTIDGAGEDWPIDYADIAPFYDRIEREVGVCGNLDRLTDLPDGIFLPPAPMRCSDVLVQKGAAKLGIKVIHVRKATRTTSARGRPACHYCGNCMAGCDVVSKYNSYDVHMLPASRAGTLDFYPDSVVREIMVSKDNRATGVSFIHRNTLREGEVQGRVVVVSCACVQSVALLMMSKSRLYPQGLANSSGHLGKHFIPHFTGGVECFLTDLIAKPSVNDEGFLDHAYVPSFMHGRKRDYARSFGIQFNYQNRRAVGWARSVKGFGKDYKAAVKERYPAFLTFSPYGEMLPNPESYIDLDLESKDKFGLPPARRHVHWGENDRKIFADMTRWSVEILKSAGAEIQSVSNEPRTNHELGGCRMGTDSRTSVVNADCRTHDVPNLYVIDGSVFPSASEKNPTHTIMALAARAAGHIAERLKRKEV